MLVRSRRALRVPRTRAVATGALVALAAALTTAPRAEAQPYSSLTFFGDSFTDMGMAEVLWTLAGGPLSPIPNPSPSPPYWPGPTPGGPGNNTDGPTWARYFAAGLGRAGDANSAITLGTPAGNNFAVSGARTDFTGSAGTPTGLLAQLSLFNGVSPIPGLIPGLTPRTIDPTGLYVVWAGVNDIRAFADAPPADVNAALQQSVNNVAQTVGALAAGGARSFLVPLAPNSSIVPEVALNPGVALLRSQYTTTFNTLLRGALAQLATGNPGSRFYSFDLTNAYAAIAADAAAGGPQYGITNLTTPCFLNFGTPAQIPCDQSLFADALHPTTAAQRVVGQVALQAVVPEPGTVTLLAGGLALLGAGAARRRRAA